MIDNGLTDIVRERLDAGVRLGEQVAKDMIALRIGPDLRMAVVGSPDYFATRKKPRAPQDLTDHNCINLRLPTAGGLYAWEFGKSGRELKARVEGQLVVNTATLAIKAALTGAGLAFVPEDRVLSDIREGRLIRVLVDWCPVFPGFHLYYPSRRQPTPAFAILVETLRYGHTVPVLQNSASRLLKKSLVLPLTPWFNFLVGGRLICADRTKEVDRCSATSISKSGCGKIIRCARSGCW